MKSFFLVVSLLAASAAVATSQPPKTPAPKADATSVSGAAALAGAVAGAQASSDAKSIGINSNSNTNQNLASGGQADADANANSSSGGNTLSVNEQHVRNAPAVGQGSFAINGCAVAGNVGGSNTSGAGFLGLAFTPEQCYDFMLAQSYQALGAYQAACEVLNKSRAGRRAAKRGVTLPTCVPPTPTSSAPSVTVVPPIDTSSYVTREELREREDRIIHTLRSK